MWEKNHQADLCVVGGGMSGICVAIAAARHGAKVVLMHDRPVLGGNASSEVRMWICGAHGKNNRETGILEEIHLENHYRNPTQNYSIWDSVLYDKVKQEENITLLLNCSCNDARVENGRILSVKGWQTTSYTWHTVEAKLFADCSGDSIVAYLAGAEYRHGREARSEFGESFGPDEADRKTMGNSLLIQPRETLSEKPFIPPKWANTYATDDDLPHRGHNIRNWGNNFWWIELGGEQHTIRDAEEIRDELLKVAFGVWDHIKNQQDHDAANWEADWIGFLPGKRESRRCIGDYIMTEHDILAEGKFHDLVAYGGWTMDDHPPGGMNWPGRPTNHHKAPSPFGIPYRSLYSRNVENLFFAGRNISVTHAALSATRVMATCSVIGQAVGTAAAIAAREGINPRRVYESHLTELQETLMDDDAWLPWHTRPVPELSVKSQLTASEGDPEPLRNGIDRPIGDDDNGWYGAEGSWVAYHLPAATHVRQARLVFDSDLNRGRRNMAASYPLNMEPRPVPRTMVKRFRVEVLDSDGTWQTTATVENNYQRLVRVPLDHVTQGVRVTFEETWGDPDVHVFAFDVRE